MQGYSAGLFTPKVGEGHISIWPWHYSAVIQGTWAFTLQASALWYGYLDNTSSTQNDQLDYKVYLDIGTYSLAFVGIRNTNRAILTFLIDTVSIGTIDLYGALSYAYLYPQITNIAITTRGIKTLSVKAATRNASATAWYTGLEAISLYRTA